MLQNLDLNVPTKWENSERDSAVQVFASQGFSLITSRRVTNWGSGYVQIQKVNGVQERERGEGRGDNTVSIFTIGASQLSEQLLF